jgi:hypothetical protein
MRLLRLILSEIIKTIGVLKDTLRNLSGEISHVQMEENQRHKRYVDQVHVTFKLETTQIKLFCGRKRKLKVDQVRTMSGTETFDICCGDKLRNLPKTLLSYFLAKPCFNVKNFRITRLSFVLKDFKPM